MAARAVECERPAAGFSASGTLVGTITARYAAHVFRESCLPMFDYETARFAIAGVLIGFALLELVSGRFALMRKPRRRDLLLDVASTLSVPVVIIPTILFAAPWVAEQLLPGSEGALSRMPWWAMFLTLLIADDLTQYGWHRLSHSSWLYPLHRAHHSAPYMSVSIVYRNNLLYYLMMPGVWFSGMLIHFGFASVYLVYAVLKMSVIIAAHSSIPWDQPLYAGRWTGKLMWIVERIISTPATHSAHHGLEAADGVTHYQGNYGNFLFLWDVLFRTAHITRRRPAAYGIEGLEPVPVFREFVWPVAERRIDHSVDP